MLNYFDIFDAGVEIFDELVMPNNKLEKGILNTEGMAFCALADYLGAELILESGVCNGGSTTIFGKYFTEIPIVSVDVQTKMEVIVRTSIFHNVTLINGDGTVLLPQAVDVFKDKKIAILIDGPKGLEALNLAGKCFSRENVVMVGVHDLFRGLYGKPKQDRILFDNLKLEKFATDDDAFVKKYEYLNAGQSDPRHSKYYSTELGGYGPVIGFMLKGV